MMFPHMHLPALARSMLLRLIIQLTDNTLCSMQIYSIYDYQVKFNVRLATENPYVPTFGADIPGGPPGLGVS